VLGALALAPLALAGASPLASADEYVSAHQVLDTIDWREADVAARLDAIEKQVPGARAFVASVMADRARHQADRARLRRRLRLAASPRPEVPGAPAAAVTLEALQAAQQALVDAHAEGLPALGDALAVDVLAHHMVDLARQLAVIGLWIDGEAERG
jgi:hypothetical protein